MISNVQTEDREVVVTVIVCAYRTGERIRPTIDAILNQTFAELKLVVIDDASGDETADIVRTYNDPRITLIENETNLGIIGARNKGLQLSETEFVATCDHDDVWLPTKLEKQVSYMRQHPECALVGTVWTVYTPTMVDGVRMPPHKEAPFLKWFLFHKNCLLHSSLLMRRQHMLDHDIKYRDGLRFADDWKLCLEFAQSGAVGIIPESLVSYYLHGENWSLTAREQMLQSGATLMRAELEHLFDRPVSQQEADRYYYTVADGQAVANTETLLDVGHLLVDIAGACTADPSIGALERYHIWQASAGIWWRAVCASAGISGPGRLHLYGCVKSTDYEKIPFVRFAFEYAKAAIKYARFKLTR